MGGFFDLDAPIGSPQRPVFPMDLPWTCPEDGTYFFNCRGATDTHPMRPSIGAHINAGRVVHMMSPSGTPL